MFKTGILGMNARNLLYIRPFNRSKAVQLADNKLKTKHYLAARGIAVAKLYGVIHDGKELEHFDWSKLPKSFVVKPNRGFGGEGILIIKDFDPTHKEFIRQMGEHIRNILDGNYSLSSAPDMAMIEQRLIPHPALAEYAYQGLPDIRVIVHNLIPIMAMLRLPTKESHGLANLHSGGVMVGIDLATGECTHTVYRGEFVKFIPGIEKSIRGFKIPAWEDVLLTASKAQLISNLGYMAIDVIVDKNDIPIVLEMNARGGLGIQIANRSPLRERLERIQGLKVTTPEKGVHLGRELFSIHRTQSAETAQEKPVIGLIEPVEVYLQKASHTVLASIDPSSPHTMIDRALAEKLGLAPSEQTGLTVKIDMLLGGARKKTLANLGLHPDRPLVIGHKDLKDFLIDPSKPQAHENGSRKTGSSFQSSASHYPAIDRALTQIDERITILEHLRPINVKEAQQRFLADPMSNPQFEYEPIRFDLEHTKTQLLNIETDDSALGRLFSKKRTELLKKLELLEYRGTSYFTDKSIALYGKPTPQLRQLAEARMTHQMPDDPEGKVMTAGDVKLEFERVLKTYNLTHWQVVLREAMSGDCSIGKNGVIFLRQDAMFTPRRVKGTIIHEIETHALTAENGKFQPYQLFQRGFGNYLLTQEGLAVYNQEHFTELDHKFYWTAASLLAVQWALKSSFADVFAHMLRLGFTKERAWYFTLKAKRGLKDTSQPGALTKGVVYLKGALLIEEFVKNGGDLRRLYVGKIAIEDLEILEDIPTLVSPKILPRFL